jgi:hypothetical protein
MGSALMYAEKYQRAACFSRSKEPFHRREGLAMEGPSMQNHCDYLLL